MTDVLILAKNDWANTGYRFSKCLRYLGLDVLMLKGAFHPFCYPEQAPIHPLLQALPNDSNFLQAPAFKCFTEDAKVVHYIASTFIDTGTNFFEKSVVMQHGGKAYRENPEHINEIYNQFVNTTIIQCPDLLGYGANNEQWVYYPVDTDFIKPVYNRTSKKLVVGHFPSIPFKKGTDEIVKVIEKLEKDSSLSFKYVGARQPKSFNKNGLVTWGDNLKRLSECDIIIETMLPVVQEHKFGEWGNTAIEAAALGKIVVTNSLAQDLYAKEFGGCALNIANDPKQLEDALRSILSLSDKEILDKKRESRHWVEKKHSIPATAQRLWDKVYKDLF